MRQSFYHLTLDAREVIAEGIAQGDPLVDIASTIGFHPTTVSREVRHYRIPAGRRTARITNICIHAKTCTITKLCKNTCRKTRCASCISRHCFDFCPDFKEAVCEKTSRWPHTCNGCTNRLHCGYERYYYRPSVAQAEADRVRSESRRGTTLSKDELLTLDELIVPLLKDNKQSVEVICNNNPHIAVSPQTLRRYIDNGHMRSIRLDLLQAPSKKVRAKARPKATKHADDGRSYADFLKLPQEIQDVTWEMDTVFGSKKDKGCLLTLINRENLLFFPFKMWQCDTENVVGTLDYLEILCKDAGMDFEEMFPLIVTDNGSEMSDSEGIRMLFIFIFVLPDLSPASVLEVFDYLEQHLGTEKFKQLFGVILTDRGIEFLRFEDLEKSCLIEDSRCHLYYADPCRADQKGAIENAHLYIRRILPKKTSFESLDAHKAALLTSHINSVPRQSLGGLCALDFASMIFPRDFLEELGIEKVSPDCVILKPALLSQA